MGDVIDLTGRLKKESQSETLAVEGTAVVLDISEVRQKMISEDRRIVKRTILTEFISVHAVVPNRGVMRVALYDINEMGLAFDLPTEMGRYGAGETVELRIYLNHATYFTFEAKVAHVTEIADEGIFRHGCEFAVETSNRLALNYFVRFLETVTTSLRRDHGDVLVSKINS